MAKSPTVRRRRLAAELRRIREARDLTGERVAAALGWSPSKISRYELGRTGLKPDEVGRLLEVYEVAGREREQLLGLAYEASQKGWWEEYAEALPLEYLEFIGLEAEATSVEQWQVEVVPGLLQTEEYARAVFLGYQRVVPIPPSHVERRVKVRQIRQEALTREQPLQLAVVLDESALLRRIGDHTVMRGQLKQLLRLADLPNVTVQVLPLSCERSMVAASFVIFGFGWGSGAMLHDVVSTEGLRSEFYFEGEADTYTHRLVFQNLQAESLPVAESRALIARTAESVWG